MLKKEEKMTEKAPFLKAAWCIIRNKTDTENRITSAALSVILSTFLNMIASLIALAALYGTGTSICEIFRAITSSVDGVLTGLFQIVFAVVMALFALVLRGIANEVGRESDINHLLALFSGITGFITLILTWKG